MAIVRRSKSECPLCRQNIPDTTELVINRELRDLVALASALHTVDQDGWEAVTSHKALTKSHKLEADADNTDVTLVPTAPPVHVSLSTVLQGGGDLLSLEPPTWLPDSHAQECGNCQQTFRWASLPAAAACLSCYMLQPEQPCWTPCYHRGNQVSCQAALPESHVMPSVHHSPMPLLCCTSTASTELCSLHDAVMAANLTLYMLCRALRRSRHHCRLCGGIFCATCSSKVLLLPPKFQQQQPQRLCDPCADLLEPLQPFLAGIAALTFCSAFADTHHITWTSSETAIVHVCYAVMSQVEHVASRY